MMQNLLINLVPKYFTFAIEKAEKITHMHFGTIQKGRPRSGGGRGSAKSGRTRTGGGGFQAKVDVLFT